MIVFTTRSCPMLFPYPQPLVDEVAIRAIRCLVRQAIHQGCFRRDQFDDLVQDAVVHLLQKARRFDPGRASWSTFCSLVVRNFLSRLKTNRRPCTEAFDDDPQSPHHASQVGESQSLARRFTRYRSEQERIEFEEDISTVLEQLPELLRDVCQGLMDESNVEQAAKQLGVSRQTVYRRKASVRERFIAESLVEYY
jgi:RNA polymerase sigma factor (sigma-70 family)